MKRGTLREKYGLREDSHCSDCPAACCCGPCALCQESRFLDRQRMFNNETASVCFDCCCFFSSVQASMVVPGLGPMTIQPQDYF